MTRFIKFGFILVFSVLLSVGCAKVNGGSKIDWTYQEDQRRLNFKKVKTYSENGEKMISGTVENVGEDPWPDPTIKFVLLDRNMEPIDVVQTQRINTLEIGSKWAFEIKPNRSFHRARFKNPTGWND